MVETIANSQIRGEVRDIFLKMKTNTTGDTITGMSMLAKVLVDLSGAEVKALKRFSQEYSRRVEENPVHIGTTVFFINGLLKYNPATDNPYQYLPLIATFRSKSL